MHSSRPSEDSISSFESAKRKLQSSLKDAQRRSSGTANRSNPAQASHDVFEEYDRLVEQLFVPNEGPFSADQLRKLILGQMVSGIRRPQRTQVLATLLLMDVMQDSVLWAFFLKDLTFHRESDELPLLIDMNLPIDEDVLASALRDTQAAKLFVDEYQSYSKADELRFSDRRRDFVQLLNKVYMTCPDSFGVFNDGFYPDAELDDFFGMRATEECLKEIHLESEKWRTEGQSRDLRERSLKAAKEQSPKFLQGVWPRRKIMAALLKSHAEVDSKAWQHFIMACLGREGWGPKLRDEELPMREAKVKEYFGEDIDSAFLHEFCAHQYAFCAVKLVSKQQIDKHDDQNFHLPLTSLRPLGKGSMGQVYSVKVKGGYLEKDDVVLAMKRMSMHNSTGNEWERVSWLREQQMSHDHIMKPTASIKIGETIFLFLEEAKYGDLTKYFEEHCPEGPQGHQERMDFLGSMYHLVHAVDWLQNSVETTYGHKVRKVSCIHKDLKGPNILVMENHQLKITDFGISSIIVEEDKGKPKRVIESSKSLPLSRRGTEAGGASWSSHYPPEAETTGEVNVKGDVWSLGTVFAECLAWMSGGEAARQNLRGRLEGKFHIRSDVLLSLKPGVRQFFEAVIQKARSAGTNDDIQDAWFFECCWSLLSCKMLVCDPEERSSINEVVDCLRDILDGKEVDVIFPTPTERASLSNGLQEDLPDDGDFEASGSRLAWESSHSRGRSPSTGNSGADHVVNDRTSGDQAELHATKLTFSQPESLGAAVRKQNASEVRSLLQGGVDATASDENLWTALHYSVHAPHGSKHVNDPQITRLLLEAAPSLVHMATDDRETPMHMVAKYGLLEHAEILWGCQPKPDLRATAFRRTPLDMARKARREKMVEWIEKKLKEDEGAQHIEKTHCR